LPRFYLAAITVDAHRLDLPGGSARDPAPWIISATARAVSMPADTPAEVTAVSDHARPRNDRFEC
jgi:hypothetical protein